MYAIANGSVILPDRIATNLAVLVDRGKIVDIVDAGSIPADANLIDANQNYISPGLVDIHIHGAEGANFNDGTFESLTTIAQACANRGITTILATTATASLEELLNALATLRQWQRESHSGANIVGAHVEGPYFSQLQRGAQDPNHIRNPNDGSVASFLEYSDVIHMLTYAPELPGAIALTKALVDRGITAAMGHSSAIDSEVDAAIAAGASHAIHLWSGQSSTIRQGPWRKPGILEASLASNTITGEIIADNKHLPPTLMKMAYKCFGPDRLCIVSDATSGAGLPEGSKFTMGDMSYVVDGGVGMMHDRTGFAGSTTLLNQMVRIVIDTLGVPVHEAVRMASLTPASVVSLDQSKGSLSPGKDADIVIFDHDFNQIRVMIAGSWHPLANS